MTPPANFSFFKSFLTLALLSTSACATRTIQFSTEMDAEQSFENIQNVEEEILEASAEILESESSQPEKIPLEINENVMKWIHYFTVKDRDRFHRFLKRGSAYKTVVQDILIKNGVPRELYYLAMIESGYVPHARSHARAIGIWQFIRGTAIRYGLKQNRYFDERRDVIRSTEAAAKYLRNLYTAFQSWYLAMAGYNAGEGRILGAIMRGGSRNFWDLVEKKALPPETRNYVPKFLAATIIGKHPEKYGFTDIESSPFPEVKPIEVPGGTSLRTVSNKMGVPYETLKTLNPQLLRGVIPRRVQKYEIWIPKELSGEVEEFQKQIASYKPPVEPQRTGSQNHRRYHSVRRGENLTLIAKRYGISVYALKQMNGLRSNRVMAGKRLLVSGPVIHRVRSGEALTVIAHRYHVPVRKIKRMNDLENNRIYVGQRLLIAQEI